MGSTNHNQRWRWPVLLAQTLAAVWAAHGVAFFLHEYAHSFTAWALGWKRNPLALHYAHPTLAVLLVQLGISQNVDEAAIFASGHAWQAASISAAGAVLGNAVVSYSLSRWLYYFAQRRDARGWAMAAYWLTVTSIGNFIDYVPVRTFIVGTDLDQDMYAVERGFDWSPWTLLLLFGVPTALAVLYFFTRIQPKTLAWLFPNSRPQRAFIAAFTSLFLFGFYGAAGWTGGGLIAHRISVVSVCVIAPLMAVLTTIFSTTTPVAVSLDRHSAAC